METNEPMTESATPVSEPAVPAWGLKPPAGTTGPIWGARAIFSRRSREVPFSRRINGRVKRYTKTVNEIDIDLLWDRQQMVGGTEEERKALAKWVNTKGMKAIKKEIDLRYITTDCNENVVYSGGGFTITANPRSSYGYLYIVAHRL